MDYLTRFNNCVLTDNSRKTFILDSITDVAIDHKERYEEASRAATRFLNTFIPWPIIAILHFRECNQNFNLHLHNGDPLTGYTIHAPKGRPHYGKPPFQWEESAADALSGRWVPKQWDIGSALSFFERYNGLGYSIRGVISPYLWDYTDQYVSGLFTKDGMYDPLKKEDRPGCVAFLKVLFGKGVTLDFVGKNQDNSSLH